MPDDIPTLLRQAAAHHAAGQLDAAGALYARILSLSPDEPNALNLAGVLARQRGDVERALALTGRALALRPDAPVFLASHGASLAEAGQPGQAVPLLRRAILARPDDAVSRRNLGQALGALGRHDEALPPLRDAVALAPGPETRLALAHGLRHLGRVAEAVGAARDALREAPPEVAEQARFLLAALGAAEAPGRAPAGYVRDLFDRYASHFDAHLVGHLGYRTPALLAALLEGAGLAPDASHAVLDLGCGTGLSGRALKPFARRLEGVDLSPRMLAEAARTGLYDALHEADLLEFLPRHPAAFGLVAAADVLNYLGDLGPALAGIAGSLAPGGMAAFSLEAGETAPYALGEGMRYRHHPGHVLELAAQTGLRVLAREEQALRQEKGAAVGGLLLVLGLA
ncbi:methyltransferase domain-containing protein [Roseomonas sp. OT10]|uniref:methyltransferase domain-containing protein n=1 Tax=Roseomonas cutis TaxID=2897332 RepID=UPI001E4EDA8B|nr:methyltransferase domain-containing protein [Roseomonas sp. OT10]UFN50184.1 methyltransferase domain-containing protein [Roseomonas sp. OT10]